MLVLAPTNRSRISHKKSDHQGQKPSNLNDNDTNKPTEIVVAITQEELEEATENLIYDRVSVTNIEADEKAIAQLLKTHLRNTIDNIT